MGEREPNLARALLLLVAVGYLGAQLLLFRPDRAPSWDEAVYLSQVTPGTPAILFAPSRARGVVLLAAPVASAGGSVTTVRVFLVVVSSAMLAAAFLPWVRTVGLAAPLAAFVFGSSWLGLFYGSEVMPNLWTGLLAVASAGVLALHLGGAAGRWGAPVAGGLLAITALFRPTDATILFAALAVSIVLLRRSRLGVLAWLGGGLVLGWLPWLVEMSVRYGGPIEAFRGAVAVGHVKSGLGEGIRQHLALTDGPTIGPEADPGVPLGGVLWWGAIATLSVVALARGRKDGTMLPVALAALAGSMLAVAYLLLVSGFAPRFLLPAYALLSVPSAAGIRSLWRGGAGLRPAAVVALAAIAALAVWHTATAERIEAAAVEARASARDVGLAMRAVAGAGRPCLFSSIGGFPQVAFASGCEGRHLRGPVAEATTTLEERAGPDVAVFIVLRTPAPPELGLGSPVVAVPGAGGDWLVYEVAGGPGSE
jgi:hypothetical protein